MSVTFWNWATQDKFYGLHYAFVAALLWLAMRVHRSRAAIGIADRAPAVRWAPTQWPRWLQALHLLAFTAGLALTNHYLTFLILPSILVLLLTPLRATRQWLREARRHAGTLLLAGLTPLLLYLYLPIRASMRPLLAWGMPDTWSTFWRQVTAQNYQGLFGAGELGTHLVDALVYTANQFGPWLGTGLLVLACVGVSRLWWADRGLLVASTLGAAISFGVAILYSIPEIAAYYVPFYMMLLWWVGIGLAQTLAWLGPHFSRLWTSRRVGAASLSAGLLLPLIALAINWNAAGHLDNFTGELFVRNGFRTLRPNAVVLTNYWDFTSPSLYFQHVLGERPDVVTIDKTLLRQPFYLDYLAATYPDVVSRNAAAFTAYKGLLQQWIDTGRTPPLLPSAYINVLNGFIDSNLAQRPVYADFIVAAGDVEEQRDVDQLLGSRKSELVPDGFGYRIAPTAADHATQDPQFDLRGITTQKVPLDDVEAPVVALYPTFLQRIGSYLESSTVAADQQVGARLLQEAQSLAWLQPFQDQRPRLR